MSRFTEYQHAGENIVCPWCDGIYHPMGFARHRISHSEFTPSRPPFKPGGHKKLRDGGYTAVHDWLRRHYGRPDRCESPTCSGRSTIYHWAKLHGVDYEHKRENFIMLCVSCHHIYDMTLDGQRRQATRLSATRTNLRTCKNGHRRSPENTVWRQRKYVVSPICRDCAREVKVRMRQRAAA